MGALATPVSGFGTMPIKGNSGAMPVQPGSGSIPVSGALPVTGNPVATTQANPYAAPTATTAAGGTTSGAIPVSATAAPATSVNATSTALPANTTQTDGINWTDGSNTVTGDFKDTYGAGTGTAITDVLKNLGTSTDSAVQALISNTNLAAGKEYGNIQASEAAGGVTPNSSTAALASGDFYSTVNSQLQSTISGMELNEENTLLSSLTNEGTAHGPDESTWDSVMNGITDVGEIGAGIAGAFFNPSSLLSGAGKSSGSSSSDISGMLADMG